MVSINRFDGPLPDGTCSCWVSVNQSIAPAKLATLVAAGGQTFLAVGVSNADTKIMNLVFCVYCPFCGQRLQDGAGEEVVV